MFQEHQGEGHCLRAYAERESDGLNLSMTTARWTGKRPEQQKQFVTKLRRRSPRRVKSNLTFFIYL